MTRLQIKRTARPRCTARYARFVAALSHWHTLQPRKSSIPRFANQALPTPQSQHRGDRGRRREKAPCVATASAHEHSTNSPCNSPNNNDAQICTSQSTTRAVGEGRGERERHTHTREGALTNRRTKSTRSPVTTVAAERTAARRTGRPRSVPA